MKFNKKEYIDTLKNEYGEFDQNFFLEENENSEIVKVVIISKSVKSIDNICKCPTIQVLVLRDNHIESLIPLYNLTTITYLDVSQNRIKDMFGVALNLGIETLKADHNQISEMYSFQVGKEFYEKEFIGKPLSYISEYFLKPKMIELKGQKEIQAFLKNHSK